MSKHGHQYVCELGSEEYVETSCKPCEYEGKFTAASGWCQECEENMCSICFRHHRKGKLCKDHVLLDLSDNARVSRTSLEGLEKCQQHFNEVIKFYCPVHDQVGCGDCMILEHKTCKMEYIPDKMREFKDGKDLEKIVSDIESCSVKTQDCLSAIQTKKDQTEVMHEQFVTDAEAFRDEIVKHVNTLTTELCNRAECIKSKNKNLLQMLEKEANNIRSEINSTKQTLQSQEDQPSKLFFTSIQLKQKLNSMKQTLNEFENEIKLEEYKFQKDSHAESIMRCECLGIIQTVPEKEIDAKEDQKTKQETVELESIQPLQDRVLRADNIDVNGHYLSLNISSTFRMLNGLYIGDVKMTSGSYFEVEIIRSGGSKGSVGIGLVPADYPKNNFPGRRKGSAGYHSDDGHVYIGSSTGESFGPPCRENDTMGCGISETVTSGVHVFFTRNGRKVGERLLRTGNYLYPAVALDTKGQLVKVTLETMKPPY